MTSQLGVLMTKYMDLFHSRKRINCDRKQKKIVACYTPMDSDRRRRYTRTHISICGA